MFRRAALAAVLISISAIATVSAGSASADSKLSDDAAWAIVKAAAQTGSISDADRAKLLTRPDIAAQATDPTHAVTTGETVTAQPAAAAATVKSFNKDRYINYFSYTGGKTLEYHFTVSWQGDGHKITNTPTRGHHVKSYTAGIYDRGFTENSLSWNTGRASAIIILQALWEQCLVKYGCLASGDPYSKWGIYATGDYTYAPRA